MEQELPRRLLEYIFECGIEYHARRRFRQWCDCGFCEERRRLTANITYGVRRFFNGLPVPGYRRCWCTDGCPHGCMAVEHTNLPPCDSIDAAIRNRMERVREKLRCHLRQTLTRLRADHKYEVTVTEEGKETWKLRTLPPRRK